MRGKKPSIEHLQAVSRYEELQRTLLGNGHGVALNKPLAHWVLPGDRRLPLVFLGRTLRDLLDSSFDDLADTPGVGRKKIRSFLDLLDRVAASEPTVDHGAVPPATDSPSRAPTSSNGFDPAAVSQVVWSRWQESVRRQGLQDEPLGRVAPTLRNVTRVIWNTPLGEYLDVSLADLQAKKTYGTKRVHSILEVFHDLHGLLADLGEHRQLAVRLVPRSIDRAERWIGAVLQSARQPDPQERLDAFTAPLLEQVRIDGSDAVTQLAQLRLGVDGPIMSVRQAARRMGLTRARVYQLLNEINDILTVRWPLGRNQVYQLLDRLPQGTEPDPALDPFCAAVELFYPATRRGADGPIDRPLTGSGE